MASADEFSSAGESSASATAAQSLSTIAQISTVELVAWAFLYYGHKDVRLLDGGLAAGLKVSRPGR